LALTEAEKGELILIPFVLDFESEDLGIEQQAFPEIGHADFRNQAIEHKWLAHNRFISLFSWV
jgi:hypothetical protein